MSVREDIIEKQKRGFLVFGLQDQIDHRGTIIRGACEIETSLTDLLNRYFHSVNPSFSRNKALSELYAENRTLGSSKKMTDIAYYLGLVSDQLRHDLGKVSRLRNRYAHDRDRKQLDQDKEMYAILQDTYLYKGTPGLRDMKPQAVLLSIINELVAQVREVTLSSSNDA